MLKTKALQGIQNGLRFVKFQVMPSYPVLMHLRQSGYHWNRSDKKWEKPTITMPVLPVDYVHAEPCKPLEIAIPANIPSRADIARAMPLGLEYRHEMRYGSKEIFARKWKKPGLIPALPEIAAKPKGSMAMIETPIFEKKSSVGKEITILSANNFSKSAQNKILLQKYLDCSESTPASIVLRSVAGNCVYTFSRESWKI